MEIIALKDVSNLVKLRLMVTDPWTKSTFSHHLTVTKSQYLKLLEREKYYIQDILNDKPADERELFITGIYPGSLGENFFDFTCPTCRTLHNEPISRCGEPIRCAFCGETSTPYEVIDASQNLG